MARACRVLIVEDDAVSREGLAAILELLGYTVMAVADGWTALQIATETEPDIVVLDIGLPRLDGFAVAKALTHTPRRHPVIIGLSGHADEEDFARARDGGFDAYLLKPGDLNELLQLIERVSTEPEAERPANVRSDEK